jgi:hypothetical protein
MIDLEVLKLDSAHKRNHGPLEAGGTMVDCTGHLFLSFVTMLGIMIIFQTKLPALIQGMNIIKPQGAIRPW